MSYSRERAILERRIQELMDDEWLDEDEARERAEQERDDYYSC